jgi:hypothetical protein
MVNVMDLQGRLLGTERLRPGDDPAAVARRILRAKSTPDDFYAPIRYH